jgi:V/A-type H+-transporting ATPase subunit E
MGLEELKHQIISEANKRAEEIKGIAELKANEIIKEAEERARKFREESLRKAEEEFKAIKARTVGEANLEARNLVLAAKQELIASVIKKALIEISAMSDREYLEFLERQLLALTSEEFKGKYTIEFSEKDRKRVTKNWLENIEKKLITKNPALKLELNENFRSDLTSGFIVKTSEVEINNSLEAIVKFKIDSIEQEVAKILFK